MNHFVLSMIKSLLRILGCVISLVLIIYSIDIKIIIAILAGAFSIAETLGILEEIFDKRKEE